MSTTIKGWVNTSPTKDLVWVKPAGSGPITQSVFINGLSPADRTIIVELLRACFAKGVSVVVDLPIEGISASKTGALGTTALTASMIVDIVESALDRPAPEADPVILERASAIGRRLSALPARKATTSSSAPADEKDEITFE